VAEVCDFHFLIRRAPMSRLRRFGLMFHPAEAPAQNPNRWVAPITHPKPKVNPYPSVLLPGAGSIGMSHPRNILFS